MPSGPKRAAEQPAGADMVTPDRATIPLRDRHPGYRRAGAAAGLHDALDRLKEPAIAG
jgi:hypothetical protein